jgi:hypothetical protein
MIFTVVHPVPWLLIVGLPFGVFRLITDPPSEPWLWFYGAAATSLVGIFVFSTVAVRRIQRNAVKKANAPGTE